MKKLEIATIIAYVLTILGIPIATLAGPYQGYVFIYITVAGACALTLFRAHIRFKKNQGNKH